MKLVQAYLNGKLGAAAILHNSLVNHLGFLLHITVLHEAEVAQGQ